MGRLPNLKLVLMSATADVDRYHRYFADLAERVSGWGVWVYTHIPRTPNVILVHRIYTTRIYGWC